MGRYLARGPNCWGAADNPRTAINNARKHLPRVPYAKPGFVLFVVHRVHEDTEVTELGGLRFPKDHPPQLVGYYDVNGRVPVEEPKL